MINLAQYFQPEIYSWVVLPLVIFFARILDVSLGTMRIIFVSRGKRSLAPFLGFFEVLIWITVIGQVVQNLSNVISYVAYAAGFAAGNYLGMRLEERLAIGTLAVRAFITSHSKELVTRLRTAGFGVTCIPAEGSQGHVEVVFTTIHRKDLPEVVGIIRELNPKAFYSVEEVRTFSEGVFPHQPSERYPGVLKKK